ncbi:MAG: pyruvate ferredoxin oxidoreductase [Lachnospiraceae bacterium]|jgi:pyruvate ferredoxin oxidoreductase beta subunit|nr:pyruvate ferredoxin oxidoreductase [Lachnospiraceae bacterium]MBR2842104.1 pyruvate ferredoxin oxidoreductase [Lachnospiraceae bacterium]MBR3262701.1 pyruvate ferredoxin oxidoreductase [Lachnospiraceae bacterium]
MAYNLKEEMSKKERFEAGHRLCAGCGAGIVCRAMMRAVDPEDQAVICNATSCLEVSSFQYPYTAWHDSYIHSAFENAAATAAGVESAYVALKRRGKIDKNCKIIAIGGDGGTYDIGFQSLSGAMERGHDFTYFCYDNEAYMNTGTQRSSATPRFASATTTPSGIESVGKKQNQKDLTQIMVAHGSPYVAQTTMIGTFQDFHEKAHKAIYTEGPTFVNVLTPCPRGWQYPPEILPQICKTAVDTCIWPLYEVEEGEYHLTYKPKNKLPVEEFMKLQGRFKHCFAPGNEWTIEEAQKYVDRKWEELLEKCN